MRDPEVIEESQRSLGAKEVTVTPLTATDEVHEYEIIVVAPSVSGGSSEENRTRVRWDLERFRGTWSWSGVYGAWIRISGTYDVTPQGEGTELVLRTDISVGVPIVGRMVERKVKASLEHELPPYVDFVRKYAERI